MAWMGGILQFLPVTDGDFYSDIPMVPMQSVGVRYGAVQGSVVAGGGVAFKVLGSIQRVRSLSCRRMRI